MVAKRLAQVTGIGLDRVAAAAGSDPAVLRLENLDTDIPVPAVALEETRRALLDETCNSWLPLTGREALREAVARRLVGQSGQVYDPGTQVVVTCGGMEGMLDVLLALLDPGSEVIVTDPTYAGMTNRLRLVGAEPVFVPFRVVAGSWRLDLDRLKEAATPKTRAVFVMNPSMPTGAVLNDEEWRALAELCQRHDLWLIYNAAMERILYDGRPYRHPAGFDGLADRTITVGSASKELRMIGWKVGWVAGPPEVMEAVATVHVYNTADPVGITQSAVAAALMASDEDAGIGAAIAEWQRRRDLIAQELAEGVIPAAGGWSMLLDVSGYGLTSLEASERLLRHGRIAATYMRDWGRENGDRFVRLVFSKEPMARLAGIGQRVRCALAQPVTSLSSQDAAC